MYPSLMIAFVGSYQPIAFFTVTLSHLHYIVCEHGCEAISDNFAVSARNCLTSTFKDFKCIVS